MLVLSIVLILFTLASGTVGKVKLFDDAVTLNRASVLVWFAWVAIAYTVLRLYQTSKEKREEYHIAFWAALSFEPGLLERLVPVLSGHTKISEGTQLKLVDGTFVYAPKPYRRLAVMGLNFGEYEHYYRWQIGGGESTAPEIFQPLWGIHNW